MVLVALIACLVIGTMVLFATGAVGGSKRDEHEGTRDTDQQAS